MRKLLINKWIMNSAVFIMVTLMMPLNVWAAGPPKKSELDNPLAITLLIVIGALLLAIALLAHVVIGAAQLRMERIKKEKAGVSVKTLSVILLSLLASSVFAQADSTAVQQTVTTSFGGLAKSSFYALVSVISIQLIVIVWMLWFLKSLIAKEQAAAVIAKGETVARENILKKWWGKMNSFRSINEEKDIELGHEYDNIRELDNKLPPWWLYGFYITIIFSAIYLWRYHVSHTAPLSAEELQIALTKAENEKANNLKKAGGGIDENTVKLLTASADIEAGKKIFTTTCSPCHGADGGGIVGPNLTDEYWLHGGSVKDVFKTIKYGVPEKGMQPWKGTFSPEQIAQLTGFIKSIKGTKVANPKEPQGDMYKEDQIATDSTKLAAVNQ